MTVPIRAEAAKPNVQFEMKSDCLLLRHGDFSLPVSLLCPKFVIDDETVGGNLAPVNVKGSIAGGKPVEVSFAPIALSGSASFEVRLSLQWSAKEGVLRRWASVRLVNSPSPKLLKTVVLEDIDVAKSGTQLSARQPDYWHPQSYPVFLRGFFTGIEFPMAATRIENGHVILGHLPGVTLTPGKWYQTRKAIYGVTETGKEWEAFCDYIEAHRPKRKDIFFNENHWWTTHVRANEADILGIVNAFKEKMYKPYGVAPDTFCVDLGWQELKSIWDFDRVNFPDGFCNVRAACAPMGNNVGIWISPSSVYPSAQDLAWAKEHGYEIGQEFNAMLNGSRNFACLAGPKYRAEFKKRVAEMCAQEGVRSIKFDGLIMTCPSTDHGHAPGEFSSEAIAEGLIEACEAAHKVSPDVWLRPTCFWWNPSPWWAFYTNSVLGTYGDDAQCGRVPSPVYRESYTSSRDFFNLQGAQRLPIPIGAQEVMGLTHQSEEPFLNDGVICLLRGHALQAMYLNPKFMDDRRWEQLAGLIKWGRANWSILRKTQAILPASWSDDRCPHITANGDMPREVYGYAHWTKGQGIVALRNPWIEPQTYELSLDTTSGSNLSVVSLYPEPRVYGKKLNAGDKLQIWLAPYETLVLSVGSRQKTEGIPDVSGDHQSRIKASVSRKDVTRVEYEETPGGSGPDWTDELGSTSSGLRIGLDANVETEAPDSELLILVEGNTAVIDPICSLKVNGIDSAVTASNADTSWFSTMLPVPEHWLFLRSPLSQGANRVALDLQTRSEHPKVSVWVWAKKNGAPGLSAYPNALPQPETISLDSACLLPQIDGDDPSLPTEHAPRPVDRIAGVFVDGLSPELTSYPPGSVQMRKNANAQPIRVGNRDYWRGLGVLAPSRVTVHLNGQYKRFQSWVGPDSWQILASHNRSTAVNFQVIVDGVKRWESGTMRLCDPAKWVDVDVSGASELELVVVDVVKTDPTYSANWADWAEARLLQ